ncbi:PDR/VanB family oxidoreductase [Actinomadura algeriensis]|uniref:Ferredoxin-NADP reductase n=1 Tax=Actinomadura algeriensis TaxID=1679523 RepID=A0ABR9K2B9_9ACTN|nr:PDR/VanB family oxidoreductase [Actinomadura algeriensis]MBE1537010.1 ferredoxin-NADP reductase [Actinomadura algeriensis]
MSRAAGEFAPPFEVEVASIASIADGVVELVLADPHGSPLPEWEPGAHVDLHLADGLIRQYSLTSDPAECSHYRVAVLREVEGRGGSEYVHTALKVGDVIACDGPRNNFPLVAAKSYHFIAGGIGITPLVQMMESAERSATPWRLTYFGRTAGSMAWAKDLEARFPGRVDVRPDDAFGRPDLPVVLGDVGEGDLVYACGPHGLLDAISVHLGDRAAEALHVERFAPIDAEVLRDAGTPFSVTLDRSGLTLEVPAGRSILEVMEERGIPVISSCREGTCGTCETAIISGEADHRDSILSDEEKADNETMMICCSRGIGTGLVIDA